MTAKCIVVNVECKGCGQRGHLRRDCSTRGFKREWQSRRDISPPVRKAMKLSPVYDHDTAVNSGSLVNSCYDDLLNTTTRVKQERQACEYNEYYERHEEKPVEVKELTIKKQSEGTVDYTKISEFDNDISSNDIQNNTSEATTIKNEKGYNVDGHHKEGLKNKCQNLESGKFNIVSVHMELFRSNKHSWINLTQIGCVVHGSDDSFFRSIKPSGLEEYLDCYKLGGDLLQALHMTREEDRTFLFRTRFESVKMSNKVVCVNECDALRSFVSYLSKYPNCVIIGVDEDTLAILKDKIRIIGEEMPNIVGYTHWKRVLKYLDVNNYKEVDLEEYCSGDLASYNSALDIARLLMKSVNEISSKEKDGRKSMTRDFYKLCKKIENLSKPLQHIGERNQAIEYVEVYSSFSPNMLATIRAEKLSQVTIYSESESEPEETGEVQVGQASASYMIQNTSSKYWELVKFMHGKKKEGIFCPVCKSVCKLNQILNHIRKAHSQTLKSSLLCPKCNKPVLPSEIQGHLPVCPVGASSSSYYVSTPTRSNVIMESSGSNPITHTTQTTWKIMEMKTGLGVVCPWCIRSKKSIRKNTYHNSVYLTNFDDHVARYHSRECVGTSLLCPSCNKEVLPSQVRSHMPLCPYVLQHISPLILPGVDVSKGYPNSYNNNGIELESYIATNYCPSPGEYVHCLRMYEHYQRTMMDQGKSVTVSPVVFSAMVPELCRKKWGIEIKETKFRSRFMGIMLRQSSKK